MNNEELVKSLRTEINTYLKNTVADLQQEIAQMQERVDAEIGRHRSDLQRFFEDLLAKGASAGVDESFTRVISDHMQIAYEDGSKEATETLAASALQPEPEPQKEADYSVMRDAVNDISAQTSQAEILKALVNHSSSFAPRGAFFVVKSDHLVGWRTFGHDITDNTDAVREIILPLNSNTLLGASVKENSTQYNSADQPTEDSKYLEKLNFGESKDAVAIPLIVRGRGVAVLYADAGENNLPIDVEALESLVRVASLTVELRATGIKPVQTAASAQTAKKGRQQSRQPAGAGADVSTQETSNQSTSQRKSVKTADNQLSNQDYAQPVEQDLSPTALAQEPEIVANGHYTTGELMSSNFGAETQQPVEVETVGAQTSSRKSSERGGSKLPIEVPEDERRLHNDARKFARLLVSEIKLYNEQKVKEGRQVGDLYSRLREAVDRSREMYNKRVSPPVAARYDYFHDELVSTLAEGEETKLGKEYPGAII